MGTNKNSSRWQNLLTIPSQTTRSLVAYKGHTTISEHATATARKKPEITAATDAERAASDKGPGASREVPLLARASLAFPRVLSSRLRKSLPLEIRDRIGSAASERHDVIFPVAGTGTACTPHRWQGCSRWNSRARRGIDALPLTAGPRKRA